MNMARSTINDCFNALYVGLHRTIGTAVGMGNLDTEGHALIAKLTLSHPLHLLAVTKLWPACTQAQLV